MTQGKKPILSARQISKIYGHVTALDRVDFDIYAGEIVALVGDNGAGKSTLIKILSGASAPSSGSVEIDQKQLRFNSPREAAEHGLQTVYQDLALAGDLSIAANMYLGREITRSGPLGHFGVLDRKAMLEGTQSTLKRLGIKLNSVEVEVSALSGGQRQSVAIARAMAWASRIVLLDEPTAALGVAPTQQVLKLMRRVRSSGLGVVVISHNMQDVLSVADRVVVLRLGRKSAEFRKGHFTVDSLVAAITGSDQVVEERK